MNSAAAVLLFAQVTRIEKERITREIRGGD